MSWDEFCHLNGIAPKYSRANKDSIRIPDDERGSYRRKVEILTERPRSLLLLGKAGRGKTYFMFSLLRALFEEKKASLMNTRFYRSIALDAKMVSEFEKWKSNERLISDLAELEYLFIDDFGLDRDTSKAERDYYDLIDRRTSFERITVFSSNLDEQALKKLFGERIASRLKECAIIEFNGPDLRDGGRL